VAEGAIEACLQPVGALWDYAATGLIVAEAGGRYGGLDGERTLAQPLLYSNGATHDALLSLLRPA
jgi:histidinol-phosphatase